MRSVHKRLAYLPGDLSLWPKLTGQECLEFFGRLHGSVDEKYRDELVERFHLDPSKRARSYSKGNRQKVALVAAFATRADLLLLDEPTNGLDPLMEVEFRHVAKECVGRGQTIFLSSHILSEVEALCARVGILRAGRLVEIADVEALRELHGADAAVAAQVVPTRRRASAIAFGVYGVALLLRMLGNASSDHSWLAWLSPLGWQTKLEAFASNNPAPLIPLALTPIVLSTVALALSVRRDTGAGLFDISDRAKPKTALLRSPATFALRRRIRDVIPWAVAVAIFGVGFGGISGIFASFIAGDSSWRDLVQQYNMAAIVTVPGFVAVLAGFNSLIMVAYGIIVIRSDYDDESAGRLDIPYSNAVSRGQWNWSQLSTS